MISKIPKTAIGFIDKAKNEIFIYSTQIAATNPCKDEALLKETLKTVDFSKEIIRFKYADAWDHYVVFRKKKRN